MSTAAADLLVAPPPGQPSGIVAQLLEQMAEKALKNDCVDDFAPAAWELLHSVDYKTTKGREFELRWRYWCEAVAEWHTANGMDNTGVTDALADLIGGE